MPRIHLKDNGDPAPCFAAPGECPKGENSPHFDTMEEALRHHAQEHALLPSVSKNGKGDARGNTAADEKNSGAFILGSPEHVLSLALSPTGEYRLLAAEDPSRVSWDEEVGEYRDTPSTPTELEGYTFISSGMERNVYLSPDGNFVYKLPNDYEQYDDNIYGKAGEISQMAKMVSQEQSYKAVRASLRGNTALRYAETSYHAPRDAKGLSVPIIQQEYLSPEEYEDTGLSREELQELAKPHGMRDVHRHNVLRHRATGTLVFFDCL